MKHPELAKYIDHTLLKPAATPDDILTICEEAKHYKTASVCVNSCYVPLVHQALLGSGVKTCCVVGFPLGAMSTATKAEETRIAVKAGAEEVDMVQNIGYVKTGEWGLVEQDIAAVVKAAAPAQVKVILETCLLTEEEKIKCCQIAKNAGAAFVKTSTGFSTGGATTADIALMRQTVGANMGVKASGGIHSAEEALAMLEAGASRIGASSTKQIVE